jgi:hypothetical protein
MSEGKTGAAVRCLILIGICVAAALLVGVGVLMAVRLSKQPESGRLLRVAVAPSLHDWLSAVSPQGYLSPEEGEEDAADLFPAGHRCLVVEASIPVRAMRPTSEPTLFSVSAADLSLVTSSGVRHRGVTLVAGREKPVLLDSLGTTNRPSLTRPWLRREYSRQQVVFAVPDSDIPGTFGVSHRDLEIGTLQLSAHHGATSVDVVRPD